MSAPSWREIEAKVSELRTETFDNIAHIVIDLQDEITRLQDENEKLREAVADLEAEQ